MELGEKLRAARLEAGLSQRQLCGEKITRNMLSQIENGTARPSMETLVYLAGRLQKPISSFLEEYSTPSPNQRAIFAAGNAFDQGNFSAAEAELAAYQPPDPVFDREFALLRSLTALSLAEQALSSGKLPYARQLLAQCAAWEDDLPYCRQELSRRRLLLLAALDPSACHRLPSLDEELLVRAQAALHAADPHRAARLLDAAEDTQNPLWQFLRGRCCLEKQQYREALFHLGKAENIYPSQCYPLLEQCFRELGDYRMAYEYACKQKDIPG